MTSSVGSSKPTLADRARRLVQAADYEAAERLLSRALDEPGDPDEVGGDSRRAEALYVLAVARRYRGRLDEALAALDELLALEPEYGRGHQERGHTLIAAGQAGAAREAFETALRHNPALPGSWRALAGLYRDAGQAGHARAANAQLERLEALPRELVSVTSMIHEGRLYRAERLCRHFLQAHPHHIEAMRLLAQIGNELEILTDAEFLLESVLELAPDYDQARYDFANLLLKMQKFEAAHRQTQMLLDRDPGNLAFKSLLANAASGIGDHHNAIALYDEVLEKSPRQVQLLVMRGHAQKTVGDLEAAVESYRAAYRIDPAHGDAYWSLANTKAYRFTDDEIGQMTRAEANVDTSADDRIHLNFALGKALEDREDFESAFRHYERGNALKQTGVRHKPVHLGIRTRAQIEVCTTELFERHRTAGCKDTDPIFIVGLPRAGSTLLEQILASHSRVRGTYELPHVIALAQRLRGTHQLVEEQGGRPRYPDILAELDPEYFRRFGEQFLADTRLYRHGADFFIDKNPNNFFHIGLIRLMLPNARVIDARRHPLACGFSVFKQLFGQGQEFSYGLESIGNYYREYAELMDHWDRVLPGFVLRVQYEDVVADLEGQVRRLLDFCGLDFEDACLAFFDTDRSVRTPSSEQVRQPIYRASLEHWRNFDAWLAPLRSALGPDLRRQFGIGDA